MNSGTPAAASRRRRFRRWISVLTVGLIGISLLVLGLMPPRPPKTNTQANATNRTILKGTWTNLEALLQDTQGTFQQLQQRLAQLQQRASEPPRRMLPPQDAAAIRKRLERELEKQLGLNLEKLSAVLPAEWSYELTAPLSRTPGPAARLTLTQTQPCRTCADTPPCPEPTAPIRLEFYPREAAGISAIPAYQAAKLSQCQPRVLGTTTDYLIVDACANAVDCENRTAARTATLTYFTTAPPP